MVNWGTKGGRDRTVPIETEAQRDVLRRAKQLTDELAGSTIPRQMRLKQWLQHLYYICRKCGIKRTEGVVTHGLRHQQA